jgi:hypothetical protein
MRVCAEPDRCVYRFAEITALLAAPSPLSGVGFCDREGPQPRFIEMQWWDPSSILPYLPGGPLSPDPGCVLAGVKRGRFDRFRGALYTQICNKRE